MASSNLLFSQTNSTADFRSGTVLFGLQLFLQAKLLPIVEPGVQDEVTIQKSFLNAHDGPSIMEIASHALRGIDVLDCSDHSYSDNNAVDSNICQDTALKTTLFDSITRALNFYGSHIDYLRDADHSVALAALKGVDSKHGGRFAKMFPLANWQSKICNNYNKKGETDVCLSFSRNIESRWDNSKSWKFQNFSDNYPNIGYEKETAWTTLNSECLVALLDRCEIPHVCEITMFDKSPKSQYQLTHTILHRILAEKMACLADKEKYVNFDVNQQMCAKMYMEAKLLAGLDDMSNVVYFRDLFSEQVALCGYLGYSDFIKSHWLRKIISWQSKSEFGCFVGEKTEKFAYNDAPITRKLTKSEKEKGIVEENNELCQPHLTSVGLMALSAYWDYVEEKCVQ